MNRSEIARIKSILESKEFREGALKALQEADRKFKAEANEMIEKHFPSHVGHTWEEGDWEYFDAMFVAYTLDCSCGTKLRVTREMLE
jgi:hypothetical protein